MALASGFGPPTRTHFLRPWRAAPDLGRHPVEEQHMIERGDFIAEERNSAKMTTEG